MSDNLLFIPDEDKVVVMPIMGNILDLQGIAKHKGGPIDFKKLRKEFEKDMARKVVEKMK